MFDKEETIKYLLKGVDNADEKSISDKIDEVYNENRFLRIKFGMDPSSPDIHLGHAVSLRKIKQLQDLGHTAVIIIGDFTGAIGDPSGKSKTRNQLTKEQVEANAKTYFEQIFKIIDKSKTEIHFNSEWYNKITFSEILNLCCSTTVARMLERDDFKNRFDNHKPISLHEFIYPLMQAYDSVMINADIEMGGTDQTFNILLGRNIQKYYKKSQQVPLFVPLLVGLDGKEKMSKSLGNYIGINESAKIMYEKVMQIPDDLIVDYYNLATDLHPDEINAIQKMLNMKNTNPRDVKMHLARNIVSLYHSASELKNAEEYFTLKYQKKQFESMQLPVITFDRKLLEQNYTYSLIDCIFSSGMYRSKSEVRRLIQQGAIKIDGIKTTELEFYPKNGSIVQVGKGQVFRLISNTAKTKTLVKD